MKANWPQYKSQAGLHDRREENQAKQNASIINRSEDNSYYEKILAQERVKCLDDENDCSTDNIAQHLKYVFISEEVIEVKVTEKISATEDSKGV